MKSAKVSYIIGFLLSIILTAMAFIATSFHLLPAFGLLFVILGLALAQFIVQLIFFLHLGQESKPRWNLTILLSALGLVLIVVIGSVWIMNHLNYNMSPEQINSYIYSQDGL